MTSLVTLSTRARETERPRFALLSLHLDGTACQVGCSFCYLGKREDATPGAALSEPRLFALLDAVDFEELAIAVSDPLPPVLPTLERLAAYALSRRARVTATTTVALGRRLAAAVPFHRYNLSVDPEKGRLDFAQLARTADAIRAGKNNVAEILVMCSLATPEFVDELLASDFIERCVNDARFAGVVLNGLKPPPPFCDRAFWLRLFAKIQPLLAAQLDRKLFLDCYVSARILGLGDCPARPDLSPTADGFAFRSCVYQPAPDIASAHLDELVAKMATFTPPARCPFPV